MVDKRFRDQTRREQCLRIQHGLELDANRSAAGRGTAEVFRKPKIMTSPFTLITLVLHHFVDCTQSTCFVVVVVILQATRRRNG